MAHKLRTLGSLTREIISVMNYNYMIIQEKIP